MIGHFYVQVSVLFVHFASAKDEFQQLIHEVLGSCPRACTTEPHFQAVDGAIDRVCRGLTPTDNAHTYFTLRNANSIDECMDLCRDYSGCKGCTSKVLMVAQLKIGPNNECWIYAPPGTGVGTVDAPQLKDCTALGPVAPALHLWTQSLGVVCFGA
eukprot:Skav210725  [mRNA]  locus=scaffold849:207908:209162:+ [translate_table: standard]